MPYLGWNPELVSALPTKLVMVLYLTARNAKSSQNCLLAETCWLWLRAWWSE